jgi:hypothetical protein
MLCGEMLLALSCVLRRPLGESPFPWNSPFNFSDIVALFLLAVAAVFHLLGAMPAKSIQQEL